MSEFPTLFSIALDYLPIQVSSVPCERIFSSVKETDTKKRNRIHPTLMEVLQILKFLLKKEWLNFTNGWTTARAEMLKTKTSRPADDLLSHLLTRDCQATMDTLLNVFHEDTGGSESDDSDDNGDDSD